MSPFYRAILECQSDCHLSDLTGMSDFPGTHSSANPSLIPSATLEFKMKHKFSWLKNHQITYSKTVRRVRLSQTQSD